MKKLDEFIPYGRQCIDEEDIQAVVDVLRSPFLTTGPKIAEFEKSIADYVGAKYAVAFSNGTAALHGACYAAGIGEGDEVITSPITFAASANCVRYMNGTVIFADIDEKTYNIDVNEIEKLITPRTKAIIPVDFTGQPADMDPIMELAKKHQLIVIEDGAHSLGATYKGRKVGKLADMTMFSFHPVKPVTTAEGGVIVTDNEEYYKKMLRFRGHGIEQTAYALEQGNWYYEMTDLGYNYRMTDVQAALGISQMEKLDTFIGIRQELANFYNEQFVTDKEFTVPYQLPNTLSGWHLYSIKLPEYVDRKKVFELLREANIGVHVHYIPVYWHPYYAKLGYQKGLCPKAEKWYEQALTLPLHTNLLPVDVIKISKIIKENIYE
ncbi:UDP-4-amino-4,6-dideoxy-N-acetyl-beta-L-altrosamine transaminase [Lysinibacillus fusiformis]|uniref:UDP-4-amino-4, 6-dideoxy-N-acetyl-beta-L-altrosamine transaminase n=1 Tax=Lysinibacillus fusiformis TaxID=28031 RepID=UPI000890C20F|nr:UDP-4-amino-4,6-dideoxy-N-acetyl-beta-L-altrosamine transaminase [Lysinibacillus fusiformis]SCX67510.1 UDP-4-amino-4,6-dideoxy-N-acetyl-beta-L-altrosamine transaminase [Lysinibacillus fusiformis]SDB53031.1 UDP-4-amino-4,6-dideoxy-N-acetyl-beta-L-altrosamine transaminase [Lysinibacillus fusiformis]SFI98218.1 UDP-4-amino-4,6-dideoxy-N-acetyl-beta-L-altrosamine transaminase [Lysinibacillus fusiformis]SFT25464.1 UDP-4-amino-4,6-dideoxy-N-acetyl-beta-L-altrosamine transaminase [Lysinibacillus fus